jgi:predicted component of type VI protein secretion system
MLGGLVLLLGSLAGAASGCSSSTTVYVTPAGSSTVTVTVHAAQLVPGTTTGQVQLQDANVPPVTINLVVQ